MPSRATLRETLFPAPLPASRTLPRWEATVLVSSLLVVGTVLALLRLGWSAPLKTIWAEDGPIYLGGALGQGFFDAIFSPYAGYLVLVPRLIAEVATLVPLEQAPAAISILSALLAALSALAVWHGCGGHVRNPYLRGGLALALLLVASAGEETLLSAAYVPWYMLIGTFWLLFWHPRTQAGAVLGGLFMLATGLSTPGVWFFMPVALLRAATVRNGRDATLVGSFMLGAVVQVPVLLAQEQGESLWTSHIWTAYLQRVLDAGLLGQDLGGELWEAFGWGFLIVLLAAAVGGLVWALWRSRPSARWFGAIAVLASLAIFVFSVYQRSVGLNIFWSPDSSGGVAGRYVLVPALLLVSAVVVFVDGAVRDRPRPTGFSWPVGVTLAVIVLAVVTSYDMRLPGFREGPYWEDALRTAANKCVSQGEEGAGIETAPPPFGVTVSCTEIESFADPGVSR
ncbi:MAG TPA: hypothetical protein VFU16_03590 [Solirubrobacterales bacterium]|nr:hypothetical protein [Solirubrobacterales bacterium]